MDRSCSNCKHSSFNNSTGKGCILLNENKCSGSNNSSFELKEDKVEYKHTGKSLTARQVIAESEITLSEMVSFTNWGIRYTADADGNLFDMSDEFLDYALKHSCFRKFLLSGGYIEKVETWVSPRQRDKFRLEGEIYTLSRIGERLMVLIGDNNANRWASYIEVKDVFNITKKEFQKLCGTIPVDELERI